MSLWCRLGFHRLRRPRFATWRACTRHGCGFYEGHYDV